MELPSRARGDRLLPPGSLTRILHRLRRVAPRHDLTTVVVSVTGTEGDPQGERPVVEGIGPHNYLFQ